MKIVDFVGPELIVPQLQAREKSANFVHQADVSRGRGTGGLADGRLIDLVDRSENIEAIDLRPRPSRDLAALSFSSGESLRGRFDHVMQQRALARAADAGHDAENFKRKRHVDRLEVVATSTDQPD